MLLKFFSTLFYGKNSHQFSAVYYKIVWILIYAICLPSWIPSGSVLCVLFHVEIQVNGEAPVMDLADEHTAEPQKGSPRIFWTVAHATCSHSIKAGYVHEHGILAEIIEDSHCQTTDFCSNI